MYELKESLKIVVDLFKTICYSVFNNKKGRLNMRAKRRKSYNWLLHDLKKEQKKKKREIARKKYQNTKAVTVENKSNKVANKVNNKVKQNNKQTKELSKMSINQTETVTTKENQEIEQAQPIEIEQEVRSINGVNLTSPVFKMADKELIENITMEDVGEAIEFMAIGLDRLSRIVNSREQLTEYYREVEQESFDKVVDLTHIIEMGNFNASEGYYLAKNLKEASSTRRVAKDMLDVLQKNISYIKEKEFNQLKHQIDNAYNILTNDRLYAFRSNDKQLEDVQSILTRTLEKKDNNARYTPQFAKELD